MSSTLHIRRLHNRYLVQAEVAQPEEIRFACEAALANLPRTLAAALGERLPATDPSLWFIRRLPLDFAIDPEVNLARAPDLWAGEIADAATAAIESGGDEVVHFPDRANYLAHFLVDLLDGCAWNKWYYAQMEGLRMLSTSTALRTAICDSGEDGLQSLTSLSDGALYSLIRSLHPSDADRVLAAISCAATSADESACFAAIADAWNRILRLAADEEERRRLLLFLCVGRQNPSLIGETLRETATAACWLARHLYNSPASEADILLQALQQGDLAALYRFSGLEGAARFAPLLRCSPDCLSALLERIAQGLASRTNEETRFTAFGGAFLLLPLLDDFPAEAATYSWPDLGDVSAAQAIRVLLLASCMGHERSLGCFRDPLLRDLMQISRHLRADMVAEWLSRISREAIRNFTRELFSWHLQTGAAEAESFQLFIIEHGSGSAVLLQDSARRVWLYAGAIDQASEDLSCIFHGLPQPRNLQCDPSLTQLAGEIFSESQIQSSPDLPLARVAADLDYLALPVEFVPARRIQLAISTAAQGLLRLFACKLHGFARSSLEYLYWNFLDCHAAVTETPNQRVVCLGHPPLHLVLSMAGMNRCNYQFAWVGDRPCAIYPEG